MGNATAAYHSSTAGALKALLIAALLTGILLLLTSNGYAANEPPCTDDNNFNPTPLGGGGLITIIVSHVNNILMPITMSMYEGIRNSTSFVYAIQASVMLYIAIYGVMFTVGIVQATISDVAIRCTKLMILSILLGGGSWSFFMGSVIQFFNNGTDEMINSIIAATAGGVGGGPPFSALDAVMDKMLSPKMIVTVLATFGHGPAGPIIGALLVASVGAFMRSIFKAMWVYLMSLVMKTLLFGLAPIFIGCILFSRTKHLFDGWLNQLLNASLQPIMLFAFFAFFARLVEACIDNVTTAPICWTQMADGLRGARNSIDFWRFKLDGQPFKGIVDFMGQQRPDAGARGPVIPIDIVVVLMFFFIADLSNRFNNIVIDVAKDISGAATNLSAMAGSMNEWFGSAINGDAGGNPDNGGGKGGKGGNSVFSSSGPGMKELFGGNGSKEFIERSAQQIANRNKKPPK